MFRELLVILKSKDPLRQMNNDLLSMIETSRRMFETVWQEAVAGTVSPEVSQQIRSMDVEVNKTERAIRKSLVEHIVTSGWGDLPACLGLMSIVKDAERLGDYCKQILNAAGRQTQGLSRCAGFADFQAAYDDIHQLFEKTRQAMSEGDISLAQQVMLNERDIRKHCDAMMDALLVEDLSARTGIPWALITRYLKRLAGHLSNIASSLVMPLHKIDYHDMDILRGSEAKKPE